MILQFIDKDNYKEVLKEIATRDEPVPRIGDSITFDLKEKWKVVDVCWNYLNPNLPKVMVIINRVMDF